MITFTWQVPAGSGTLDRVGLSANSLALNGGAITGARSAVTAELAHAGVSAAAGQEETQTDALTVLIDSAPEVHDGSSEFDVRIAFSETLHDGFSYRTLRDEAFTVTGEKVLNATRVDRTGDERNRRWDVTVEPSGDSDFTLVLGAGPACG